MSYRTLEPHETIEHGDEYRLGGCDDWYPVRETVGRTVEEQMDRYWNQCGEFRRISDSEE
jgi:hypothetical protein